MYDLIIIGGGPAGISAGIYAARYKLNTLLVAKSFGGQMAQKSVDIENYPGFEKISGLELIEKFQNHLKKNKIDIEMDLVSKVAKIDGGFSVTLGSKKEFQAKTLIIASGSDPRPLEVPGEKEFIGKGVSYCTTCDAPMFEGKKVAVIGGGNSAFEAAWTLAKYAEKIYILEYGSRVKADPENRQRIEKIKKIEIILNAQLKEIRGKEFVISVVYIDRPSLEEKELALEGVFVAIGLQPVTSFVKGLVDFNEKDEIKVDPHTGQTSTPGIFAAGDADSVPYKQIVIACGEGAKAAMSVYNYLQKSGK